MTRAPKEERIKRQIFSFESKKKNILQIIIYIYENSLFSLLHFNFSKLILSSIGRRKNFVRRTFLFFLERKFNSKIVSGKNNNFLTLRLFPFLVYFIEKIARYNHEHRFPNSPFTEERPFFLFFSLIFRNHTPYTRISPDAITSSRFVDCCRRTGWGRFTTRCSPGWRILRPCE